MLLMASWGPVLLGFGDPFAAAILAANVVLSSFAWKT